MSLTKEAEPQFQKAVEHLKSELATVRTGRATPALVEDLQIPAYGASQPLKSLASISTPDAKTIQIEPWDASVATAIDSAIQSSSIGITPLVDGKIIRLTMPMMTDETRQKMVKVMKEKIEEAKIAIRQIREDVKKQIEKQEGVGKDDIHGQKEELDEAVKRINAQIDEIAKNKETEITTV